MKRVLGEGEGQLPDSEEGDDYGGSIDAVCFLEMRLAFQEDVIAGGRAA